jgi:ABC-type branched-subunit amino acid transport system permease subunit
MMTISATCNVDTAAITSRFVPTLAVSEVGRCFAVGAYTSALLTKAGFAIGVGMLAACVVTALVGVAASLVTIRLRGDYLAIVTLGFAETVRIVASNAIPLTNGTDGISGIPCSCSRPRVSRSRFCRRSRPSKALRFASS